MGGAVVDDLGLVEAAEDGDGAVLDLVLVEELVMFDVAEGEVDAVLVGDGLEAFGRGV